MAATPHAHAAPNGAAAANGVMSHGTGISSNDLDQQAQVTAMAELILRSPKHDELLTRSFVELKIAASEKVLDDVDDDDAASLHATGSNSADLCNLFIGDLSKTATEDMLRTSFNKFGEVVAVDVKRDKVTGNNLGYGFVQFATHEAALAAKTGLEGFDIDGRRIRLGWAQKNTTLFIGDLDGTVTTQQLREAFSKFGPIIENETFVKAGSGKFGFVRFRHRCDAEQAKQDMTNARLGSRVIRIGWGDSHVQRHCVHVHFDSQHDAISEAAFRQLFEPFGVVTAVNLPRYAEGKLKGFGFIHFDATEDGEKAAAAALSACAGKEVVPGVPIKCSYGKRQGTAKQRSRARLRGRPDQFNNRNMYNPWIVPIFPYPPSPMHAPFYVSSPQNANNSGGPNVFVSPTFFPTPSGHSNYTHSQSFHSSSPHLPPSFPASPTGALYPLTFPSSPHPYQTPMSPAFSTASYPVPAFTPTSAASTTSTTPSHSTGSVPETVPEK